MYQTCVRPFSLLALIPLLTRMPGVHAQTLPTFQIELEAGPVWQTMNDVEIPNDDTGTRFSLADLAGKGPWPAGRLYLTWNPVISHEHDPPVRVFFSRA